jgi:hypothetical protein
MVLAQVTGFLLFTVERGASLREAQRADTIERSTRLAALLGAGPLDRRADLIQAATSRGFRRGESGTNPPFVPRNAYLCRRGGPGHRSA